MKILHTSDIHGHYHTVDTGDFFPNKTRGDHAEEVRYQSRFAVLKSIGARVTEMLDGKPLISVGGNHDYISLAKLVQDAGGVAYDLTEGAVTFNGKTFAGFREVPWIQGETHSADFGPIVDTAMAANPDVLVTHAPPAGIMNNKTHGGVGQLTNQLAWAPHNVTTHFFGHIHTTQGVMNEMGVQFINGAGKALVHTI